MEPAKVINLTFASVSEYDEDIWDVRNLGFSAQPASGARQLSFTSIPQTWLRQAVKQYIRYTLATLSFGSARGRLTALNKFAVFLSEFHPQLQPVEINRTLIVEYLSYLSSLGVSSGFRASLIGGLKSFLTLGARYGWVAISPEPLIFREDYPRQKKHHPDTSQQRY